MIDHDVVPIMLDLVKEIDEDVERWNLDRAYMIAGGVFLTTAHRLGWPAADRALSFVLAVRRLANMNRQVSTQQQRERARQHYEGQRDVLLSWLSGPVTT